MKLDISLDWFERQAALEGELAIGAGLREKSIECEECGQLTHVDEAACLHCGALKDWAQD